MWYSVECLRKVQYHHVGLPSCAQAAGEFVDEREKLSLTAAPGSESVLRIGENVVCCEVSRDVARDYVFLELATEACK